MATPGHFILLSCGGRSLLFDQITLLYTHSRIAEGSQAGAGVAVKIIEGPDPVCQLIAAQRFNAFPFQLAHFFGRCP